MKNEDRSSGEGKHSDHAPPEKMGVELTNDPLKERSKDIITPVHPYEFELLHFKPNDWQLKQKEPEMYTSLESSNFTMVDSKLLLDEMMLKLKEVKEIAIDLEHHSYRSFRGIVCLVQISTRSEDFVIDSLKLKDELSVLNTVCTDENILKVLHGSEHDILWLQRDFGVFMINMFDTQKAARVSEEEAVSLAHLLKKYCNVNVNKLHQIGDWRPRPLPDDMVKYAREDSHYLLYIYDIYRNALLKRGEEEPEKVLLEVYKASTTICGNLHREQTLQSDSHLICYRKTKGTLNIQQMECFRLLYKWRYKIAKEKDESTGYVLPNKTMLKIAQDLPREPQGIVSCCHPMPPFVYEHIEDVHKLVLLAIENVPEVPKEPERQQHGEGRKLKRSTKEQKERLQAIQMVNELFMLQMKKYPNAAPSLLKVRKENDAHR